MDAMNRKYETCEWLAPVAGAPRSTRANSMFAAGNQPIALRHDTMQICAKRGNPLASA